MRTPRVVALVALIVPLAACRHYGELGNVGFDLRIADVLYEFESGDRVVIGTTLCPRIEESIVDGVRHLWANDDYALGCYDESVSGPAQFDGDRCWLLDTAGEVIWELTPHGIEGCFVEDVEFLPDRIRITVVEPEGQLRLGFDDWRVRAPNADGEDPQPVVGLAPGRTLEDLREGPAAPRRVIAGQLDVPMLRLDDDLGRLWFADADVEFELVGEGATAVEPAEPADPDAIPSETRQPGERPLVLEPDALARIRATLATGTVLESPELIAVPQTDAVSLDLIVMLDDEGHPAYAYADVRDDQERVLHAAPIEWDVVEGALGVLRGDLGSEGRTGEYATLATNCLQPSASEPLERHAILRARLGALEDTVELNWTEPPLEPDDVDDPFEPDESCMFGDDLGGDDEVGGDGEDTGIDDRGCACSSDTEAPSRGAGWLAFAALLLVRRRRVRSTAALSSPAPVEAAARADYSADSAASTGSWGRYV